MKNQLLTILGVSALALTACSSSEAGVGSRDDIIVNNRGDVKAAIQTADVMPAETAPLLTPEETMETLEAASDDISTSAPVAPAVPEMPMTETSTMIEGEVQAVNEDVIVPVTTPSVASGEIVVEVPEAVVQTPAGEAASVSNVVTEHQGVDEYAPVQPAVTENQEMDSAEEALEEIEQVIETAPSRVSPYIPTY